MRRPPSVGLEFDEHSCGLGMYNTWQHLKSIQEAGMLVPRITYVQEDICNLRSLFPAEVVYSFNAAFGPEAKLWCVRAAASSYTTCPLQVGHPVLADAVHENSGVEYESPG